MKTIRITMADTTYEKLKKAVNIRNKNQECQGKDKWKLKDFTLVAAILEAEKELKEEC